MGELDTTLIALLIGDNGASKEGGAAGTINELQKIGGMQEDPAWLAANVDGLGGEDTYSNYQTGWAWALNAPFPGLKANASRLGGIRNGLILAWPQHVARPGAICAEFGHVIDLAPTLYEAAKVPAPDVVYGVKQKPLDGESLLPSLTKCEAGRPRTQYFEMGGNLGLYQNGWFATRASGDIPGRPPVDQPWELYNLDADFSQSTNIADANPDRLKTMVALFDQEARRNNVYPLNAANAARRGAAVVAPGARAAPKRIDLWGADVSIPAIGGSFPRAQTFQLEAEFELAKPRSSGVITALASRFAGWSLFVDQGQPIFVYARSTNPKDIFRFASSDRLPEGRAKLRLKFTLPTPAGKAQVQLFNGDREIAGGEIGSTFLTPAGLGEQLDAGRDTGVPVTDYRTPLGQLEGQIRHVSITFDR
jgi:arylsulfatase